jgi:hypothetical protein
MIRRSSLPAAQPDDQEHSMRFLEWALALLAAAAAAALTFLR